MHLYTLLVFHSRTIRKFTKWCKNVTKIYFYLTDNRLQVIDTDIFFAYRKYKPKDVPPIYLDKSSITATSSIQRQYPGNQISKQQKVVSPEKPISPTSNLIVFNNQGQNGIANMLLPVPKVRMILLTSGKYIIRIPLQATPRNLLAMGYFDCSYVTNLHVIITATEL